MHAQRLTGHDGGNSIWYNGPELYLVRISGKTTFFNDGWELDVVAGLALVEKSREHRSLTNNPNEYRPDKIEK